MTSKLISRLYIPMWGQATIVVAMCAAMIVWFATEHKRQADEAYMIAELRKNTTQSAELMAGEISLALLTRNRESMDNTFNRIAGEWPDITLIHVTDDKSQVFAEWQRRPILFGEGILKYESRIVYGGQYYGVFSVYIDQNSSLQEIRSHVRTQGLRLALNLFALLIFASAVINYVAMKPVKEISDELYKVISESGNHDNEDYGADEISRLRGGLNLLKRTLGKSMGSVSID